MATPLKDSKTGGSIRSLVSQKKVRFQKDGFDLDLTYIDERIIAMGFPSSGTEGVYRNPLDKVQAFFLKYHPRHYKIYNLCSERKYEAREFETIGGKVAHYPFDDHNPPPLSLIPKICDDVQTWFRDQQNVAAIHCKAGKGRTGCIVACLLLHLKQAKDAKEALEIFGAKRTSDGQGVTIPSQKRYIDYYDQWLKLGTDGKRVGEPKPEVTITGFHLQGKAPDFDVSGGCDPYFVVETLSDSNNLVKVYDQNKDKGAKIQNWKDQKEVKYEVKVPVSGSFKVTLRDSDKLSKDDDMAAFFLHSGFLTGTSQSFGKADLDKAFKNKEWPSDFKLTIFYDLGKKK